MKAKVWVKEPSMRAAVLIGFGGVDKLEVREVPDPTTGPGEIKVRVVARGINPIA